MAWFILKHYPNQGFDLDEYPTQRQFDEAYVEALWLLDRGNMDDLVLIQGKVIARKLKDGDK